MSHSLLHSRYATTTRILAKRPHAMTLTLSCAWSSSSSSSSVAASEEEKDTTLMSSAHHHHQNSSSQLELHQPDGKNNTPQTSTETPAPPTNILSSASHHASISTLPHNNNAVRVTTEQPESTPTRSPKHRHTSTSHSRSHSTSRAATTTTSSSSSGQAFSDSELGVHATVFVPGTVRSLPNLLAIIAEVERLYGPVAEFRCPTIVSTRKMPHPIQ